MSSRGCSARRAREIDAHRLDAVRRAASRFGAVVLLKGADTLVAAPREGVLVATYGTPALATAGSGRRADRRRRGVPRQGDGAAARRGRRARSRTASPRSSSSRSAGVDRLRPAARAAARARRARPAARAARREMRSEITIDLGALRRNVGDARCARSTARSSGPSSRRTRYGHGAVDCAGGGARRRRDGALRRDRRRRRSRCGASSRSARILVLGPASTARSPQAREARLELVVVERRDPGGCPACTSSSTRAWGAGALSELPAPTRDVVGVMTHLATADSDLDFARVQIERFREATEPLAAPDAPRREQRRRAAPARVALRRRPLRDRALRPLAVRRRTPPTTGSSRCSRWRSEIAQSKLLRRGESTGYGRRFVAERDTWIGILPVGLRRRLPPRPDRHRGASSRASAAASSARSRWTPPRSSSTASCRRARR